MGLLRCVADQRGIADTVLARGKIQGRVARRLAVDGGRCDVDHRRGLDQPGGRRPDKGPGAVVQQHGGGGRHVSHLE